MRPSSTAPKAGAASTTVATLIAEPRSAAITGDAARAALTAVAPGAEDEEIDWLSEGAACDLPVGDMGADVAERRLRAALGDLAVDIVVQPRAWRRKRLLVADMESTIIVNEMVDELADYLNIRQQIEDITARAMNGDLPFRQALRDRTELLGGLEEEVMIAACGRIRLMPGAETLVRTMAAAGAHTALVTGGYTTYAAWVSERLGFDEFHANWLEIDGGIVTGRVREPILGRRAKREHLEEIARRHLLGRHETMAVGDGANDLDMLAAAGIGVAFRAKPAVRASARAAIDHGDLTALLYMQGFRQSDFVTSAPEQAAA